MVGRRNLDLTVQGNAYTVELHLTALHPMYKFGTFKDLAGEGLIRHLIF